MHKSSEPDFIAEDEGRLSPFEDDNPKDDENTVFRAGSDNSCQTILTLYIKKWYNDVK